ncbi:MAG: prohibitin family protein [Desulfurococcales archaeon]|nr:prohibitin family protein [Desulfurococcales archaeon]
MLKIARVFALAVILAIVFSILAIAAFSIVAFVDVGRIAVLVDPISGSISKGPSGPSWFVKAPWVEVVMIPIAVQGILMAPGSKEMPIEVLSRDGLMIEVDLNVRYVIKPEKAVDLYRKYPDLAWERQISQIIREAVRNVIANYTAVEVIEKRGELDLPIREAILRKIGTDESLVGAVEIIGIEVLRIAPPQGFLKAIEEKLTAQQRAIAAEYERQRTIIQADAERQAQVLRAQGIAQARIIDANATRDALLVVLSATGNDTATAQLYLWLLGMRQIAESGANIVILTGSAQPLITIPYSITNTTNTTKR